MRRKLPARLLALLCACLMCVGLGAVAHASAPSRAGADSPPSARTWHVLVGAQGHHGAIQTMGFYPKHLWIDQGDSVVFVAHSAEIHTVTFFASKVGGSCPSGSLCTMPVGGFNPGDPLQSTPQGGATYDGSSYYNSGVMTSATGDTGPLPPFVQVVKRYRLSFPDTLAPGAYQYVCLVHGMMMTGKIIVQPKGTPYPFTQQQENRRSHHLVARDVADGARLWTHARRKAARLTRDNPGSTVLTGVMDQRAMVMRFVPSRINVPMGHRVHFLATGAGEPHTVTFGSDETGCGAAPCNPEQPWNVTATRTGNLKADYPARNGDWTGSPEALNSGVMLGLPPSVTHLPQSLTVRFTRTGRFRFTCALHDYMGMVGQVHVERPRH